MKNWLEGLVSLFYPRSCLACGEVLTQGEDTLCTRCLFHMPRTDFHSVTDNPVARHFWGKVPIRGAAALYYYNKGQRVQRLVYNLKYRRKKEAGLFAGRLLGRELVRRHAFGEVDEIVPVPLHPSRLRSRGYNQSETIARGLADVLGKRLNERLLVRARKSASQTRKHRFERWQNVDGVFALAGDDRLPGKHYLVVDDVITTGSTLASCAQTLLAIDGSRVSVAALAFAHHA